ncbi:MAG: flagellar biosynthesis anti-sigma factor FlgM [Pseudomonadota bacterium]
MNISGIPGLTPISPTAPSSARQATAPAPGAGRGVQVQLSSQASWVSQLRQSASGTPGVRMDEVQRARQEIANGTLDANINMNSVLDALIMEL